MTIDISNGQVCIADVIEGHDPAYVDLEFNVEYKLQCLVVSDGLDGAVYIVNKEGVVIESMDCGFSYWIPMLDARIYLDRYVQDIKNNKDHKIGSLEKIMNRIMTPDMEDFS